MIVVSCRKVVRATRFFLMLIYHPLKLSRGPISLIQVEFFEYSSNQPILIVTIDYFEGFGQTRILVMHPQEPVANAVEGSHPHAASWKIKELFYPPSHFTGCFIRERDRENLQGRDTLSLYEPADSMCEDPGFATTGASKNQDRPRWSGHSQALRIVEGVENMRNIHHAILLNTAEPLK